MKQSDANSNGPAQSQLAYTPRETAEQLRISIVSLWRLERRGLIKPSRALRTPRFSREEIERFLRETA